MNNHVIWDHYQSVGIIIRKLNAWSVGGATGKKHGHWIGTCSGAYPLVVLGGAERRLRNFRTCWGNGVSHQLCAPPACLHSQFLIISPTDGSKNSLVKACTTQVNIWVMMQMLWTYLKWALTEQVHNAIKTLHMTPSHLFHFIFIIRANIALTKAFSCSFKKACFACN